MESKINYKLSQLPCNVEIPKIYSSRYSKLVLLFLIIQTFFITLADARQAKSHLYNEEQFPELTDEEIARAKQQYIVEDDIDQKGYLEPVVKPEKFDLNKDRKISKEELKKAIKYCIYPKEGSRIRKMTDELKNHVNSQVDLYVNNLNVDHLSYRQFGKFMNRVVADEFINYETMTNVHMKGKDFRETSMDL